MLLRQLAKRTISRFIDFDTKRHHTVNLGISTLSLIGSGWQGAATRALVGIRDRNGARGAWATHAEMARRSGTAPLARAHPLGREGVVYRPSRLEHRAHRIRVQGPVECGGIVPPGQEGRGRILGAFAPWADNSLRLHTFATVIGLMLVSLALLTLVNRKSASGTIKTLAESHFGPCGHERAWPTCDRDARTGLDGRPAQGGQSFRSGTLDANTSFI